jgi:hypothetical protein
MTRGHKTDGERDGLRTVFLRLTSHKIHPQRKSPQEIPEIVSRRRPKKRAMMSVEIGHSGVKVGELLPNVSAKSQPDSVVHMTQLSHRTVLVNT